LTHNARSQRTIAGPAEVTGFGYWSGRDVRVEFRPAPIDSGIRFVRSDLDGCPGVPATIEHRVETPRRSSLRSGSVTVDMIEHLMAALAGLEIDNCEVRVDQPEMPGCDGSCLPFVEALDSAGIVVQDAPRRQRIIREFVRIGTGESWIEARPSPTGQTVLEYRLDYGPENPIGRQSHRVALTPDAFRRELAACRTFMLKQEAEWLLAQGLGQRATAKDLLVFAPDGLMDNTLRFANECARHKTMDLVGDLALAGSALVGEFTAYRSGHRLNAELVQVLLLPQSQTSQAWRRCA
jgi:UDP-3-O-[3-hydroxymyristoyl] N-acetylglucosamine deacetylase